MEKLIIEASINESARKEDNPNVPYGPEEGARDGIAAAKAGAAIIHYHPRDEQGENLWQHGTEMYLECYRLIRAECPDVLVYPTQRGAHKENTSHLFELAHNEEEGLELATVDIFPEEGITGHDGSFVAKLLEDLRALNVKYSIGVRHTGHMRHLARFHEQGLIGDTLIMKIFWNEFSLGPPPGMDGLKMYLDLLPPGLNCQWFNTVYDGTPGEPTLRRSSMLAAATGGHIRTGIGENSTDARRQARQRRLHERRPRRNGRRAGPPRRPRGRDTRRGARDPRHAASRDREAHGSLTAG